MRLSKRIIAGLTAALLALGLAACDVDEEALEDLDGDMEELDDEL